VGGHLVIPGTIGSVHSGRRLPNRPLAADHTWRRAGAV